MKEFNEQVIKIINLVEEAENNKIKLAASILYNSFVEDGVVHVFATGHSHMFAEEMFYRSGGLVNVDPVLVPALMQHEGAIRSTKLERLSGLAKVIFDAVDKKMANHLSLFQTQELTVSQLKWPNKLKKIIIPLLW